MGGWGLFQFLYFPLSVVTTGVIVSRSLAKVSGSSAEFPHLPIYLVLKKKYVLFLSLLYFYDCQFWSSAFYLLVCKVWFQYVGWFLQQTGKRFVNRCALE